MDPVEAAWQRCRETRPDLAVSLEQFRAYLDKHRPADVSLDDQLRTWCLDDLYLVCGAIAGDAAAVAAVERELVPIIDVALSTWDRAIVDETRQRLRVMLVVDHADRGPLLAQYSGRGALSRWIRVVAAREANKTRRADTAAMPVDDDAMFDRLAPPSDPLVSAVKRDAVVAVKAAFVTAIAELEHRERTTLRLHLLDGLTIDEIAPMYDTHRSTVARWIASARKAVLDKTRRKLMHELRLDKDAVDSMIRLVQSRIELSGDELKTI